MSDHRPSDVCWHAYLAESYVQVFRNGFVNETSEFRFVSYKRGYFVSPVKRQSQDASAAIARCAKEKDFHNRTFEFDHTGYQVLALQSTISD